MNRILLLLLALAAFGCAAGEKEMDIDEFYDNTAMSQPAPPMGWNSYCTMNCDPTEKDVLEIARCMADNGYLKAGYNYINIDDGWLEKERDEEGKLVARKDKFPRGMVSLIIKLVILLLRQSSVPLMIVQCQRNGAQLISMMRAISVQRDYLLRMVSLMTI